MAAITAKELAAALASMLVARAEAGACDGTRVPTSVPALRAQRDFAAIDAAAAASGRGCDVTYAEHTDVAFANSNSPHSCSARFESSRAMGTFEHIPKTGGSAIESFLGLHFQGHTSMRRKHPYEAGQPYFVSIRHPIERIVSWYSFVQVGAQRASLTRCASAPSTPPT